MRDNLNLEIFHGHKIKPYLLRLANLRMQVFKEYPYLYVGELQYELDYLATYVKCPASILILVLDNNEVVGASTAIPLEAEIEEFKKPFIKKGIALSQIFYLGESVLLPAYRGKKIYQHFFEMREQAARDYGCSQTAFAAVERSLDDPRRPKAYRGLEPIWQHFNYTKHPELCAHLSWPEYGDLEETAKPLIFWLKQLC